MENKEDPTRGLWTSTFGIESEMHVIKKEEAFINSKQIIETLMFGVLKSIFTTHNVDPDKNRLALVKLMVDNRWLITKVAKNDTVDYTLYTTVTNTDLNAVCVLNGTLFEEGSNEDINSAMYAYKAVTLSALNSLKYMLDLEPGLVVFTNDSDYFDHHGEKLNEVINQ